MPRGRPRKSTDDVLLKSAEFIGWALGGLEREIIQTRERLTSLTAQAAKLRARVGGRPRAVGAAIASPAFDESDVNKGAAAGRRGRRRRMSPEARKRISEMMKKRWAERRKKNS
jgi:hypothetical protein